MEHALRAFDIATEMTNNSSVDSKQNSGKLKFVSTLTLCPVEF